MFIPLTTHCRHALRVLRPRALTVAVLLTAVLLLPGCVSSKYQAASALGDQPQRMDLDLGGGPGLKTRLDTVIIYQGPGSWKKSAYWDEFLVTIVNESEESITLTSASLVDYASASMPAGTDPWLLEKASQVQRDRYTRAGVNFALNTLGYAAFTYGAVGTGVLVGAAASGWGGVTAGAVVGLAAMPVTAIVIYANNQRHGHAIEREFNRRRVALPLTLPAGQEHTGSLFFPMTVSPQALRLGWVRGTNSSVSLLPLPMLAGMYRTEPAK